MKRIVFILMILVFGVHFTKAQSLPSHSDSVLVRASTFLEDKFLVEAKVFCEKNSNGVKKYEARGFEDLNGGNTIMYHFVPGVISMAMRFEIADTFDIQNIRYSIIEGIDSVRSTDQQFINAKHKGKFHVVDIQGIECSQKSVLVELYDLRNPQLHIRIMIGTQTSIPKPEMAWFAYMKDNSYKNLFTEKAFGRVGELIGFIKTEVHPSAYFIEIRRPGLFFWQNGDTLHLDFNNNFELIDTTVKKDFLSKKLYADGFRYRIKSWLGFLELPGTYSILIKSDTAGIKDGRIEYNAGVVLSKSTFKLHYTIKQILVLLMLFGIPMLIMGAVIYFFFRIRNRRQQKKLQQQNELTKLKLQGIRSQLNPHFVFNALAGIQNLMNKQETEKANNYLTAFSRITRSVLDNSAKELITIDDEVKLLTDYLQMEQLRFGFQYTIIVDEELDKHNIEIPAMLLQPFVENAVKHGISSLKENGSVQIEFRKIKADLRLSVTDNGKGFDSGKEYNGLGLQLSKSRIALFNTIYKDTPAQLNIDSSAQGTKVLITLNNWI